MTKNKSTLKTTAMRKAAIPANSGDKAKTAKASTGRECSKLGTVITLLRRKEGATIEQLMKATGWQTHSVRGAMSGAIKKKHGLAITSVKSGGIRSYRIGA